MLIITFFFVSHRKKLEMSISCFLSIDVLEYAGGFFWLDLTYVYDFRTVRIFFREILLRISRMYSGCVRCVGYGTE